MLQSRSSVDGYNILMKSGYNYIDQHLEDLGVIIILSIY